MEIVQLQAMIIVLNGADGGDGVGIDGDDGK